MRLNWKFWQGPQQAVSDLDAPPAWPGTKAPEKGFPNWQTLLSDVDPEPITQDAKRVLIATNTGLHGAVVTLDSTLAACLKLRGADVHFSLCDGILQGCLMSTVSENLPPQAIIDRKLVSSHCKGCFNRGSGVFDGLGVAGHRMSSYLTPQDYQRAAAWAAALDIDSAPSATLDGIPVGEHAYAGTLRYFASGNLRAEPLGEQVLQRYLEGGALMQSAFSKLLDEIKPEVVVLHHGIYSPQGIAARIAAARGIRVVTWVVAYRKSSFIFSHDDTYHHTLMHEPTAQWENLVLSSGNQKRLTDYLSSRSTGSQDWIYFHKDPDQAFTAYAKAVGIDQSKPIVSLLTNVMWDAQLHYPENAFPSMLDWLVDSIETLGSRPDLQVIVRVHPAEARGAIPAKQTVIGELSRVFGDLPANVFIVAPTDEASTYEIAAASNAVVIFGTKMGVELTPMGMPVIVAGEAWIRNKGLTTDVNSREEYKALLQRLPFHDGEGVADRARALNYAFHFFFRRMIPIPCMQPSKTSSFFSLNIESAQALKPGNFRGIDTICEGILNGSPFVYPAENEPAEGDSW